MLLFFDIVLDDVSDEMLAARDFLGRFLCLLLALAPRVDDLDLFGFQCRVLALRRRRLCATNETRRARMYTIPAVLGRVERYKPGRIWHAMVLASINTLGRTPIHAQCAHLAA